MSDDLDDVRAELQTVTADLAEANKVIDAVETSRLAVLLELQQEQAAHAVTKLKLAQYEACAQDLFTALDRLLELRVQT